MPRVRSDSAASSSASNPKTSPIPRVTRAQAKQLNRRAAGEATSAPRTLKRTRKQTPTPASDDGAGDSSPTPQPKKRVRPGKKTAGPAKPVAQPVAAKRELAAKAKAEKQSAKETVAHPAQSVVAKSGLAANAKTAKQPAGNVAHPAQSVVVKSGLDANTQAAKQSAGNPVAHPAQSVVAKSDLAANAQAAKQSAGNTVVHPAQSVAGASGLPANPQLITPLVTKTLMRSVLPAVGQGSHLGRNSKPPVKPPPAQPSQQLPPRNVTNPTQASQPRAENRRQSPGDMHRARKTGVSEQNAPPGYRVSTDGLYQTSRALSGGSHRLPPPQRDNLFPVSDREPESSPLTRRIPAPQFDTLHLSPAVLDLTTTAEVRRAEKTGAVGTALSSDPDLHNHGDWGGCGDLSPHNTISPDTPSPSSSHGDRSPTLSFNIRGHGHRASPERSPGHCEAAEPPKEQSAFESDSSGGSDYGKEQDAALSRRARSRQRERDDHAKQDAEQAAAYQLQERLQLQEKLVLEDIDRNLSNIRHVASHSRSTVPLQRNVPVVPVEMPADILTGFDPMPDGEDPDDDDDDEDQPINTSKGKGKASLSGNKGGRMSAQSVGKCQAFGAEVHRGALALAAELNVNLITVMRTADLTVKVAKVGNFANSLRMVIRHDYADRVAAGEDLGM